MGCGGSKPEEGGSAGAAAATSTEDVKVEPAAKTRKMSGTKRRVAVRAEVEDEEEINMDEDVSPKTDEQREFLKESLTKNDIFSGLKEDQIYTMIKGFYQKTIQSEDKVITQGEMGDHFYVVESGKYEARLSQAGDKTVATYGPTSSFGELALLYNAPRAATVVCTTTNGESIVWALERKRFRNIMQGVANVAQGNRDMFLKSVPMLSPLTDSQRSKLSDVMEELFFAENEYVVSMGDIADALYFIKSGEVACHMGDKDKGDILRMKTGDVFGESCLDPNADNAVRKANVVAVASVTVLKLTAAVFKEQLGSLSDVVAYNFKRKVMEGVEIEKVQLFAQLTSEDQEELLNRLVEREYKNGEVCIEQGQAGDTFYVVKSGKAAVIQEQGEGKAKRELAQLSTGMFFGERALLKSEPAGASVVAAGDLVCYCCDRKTFTELLGPLQSLIDEVVRKREEMANRPDRPKFADLELRRILGVGTFGRVKLVVHKNTGDTYALKCMRKAQVVATKQQSHVLNEKKILAMMDHPFILALVQTYQDAGELYMLIELSLGGELFTLLAKRAPLFDQPAKFYAASVVSMFSYMHSLKVIYRDLKPENLLLDKDGYLKLVDFGFAKILNDRTWTLCGTPEYLAPEIILNKGHGFGADWWCVGILSFECLTGTTPFVSNDPMEGYRKIIKCRVPWPAQLSSMARDFIDRLLCVDPSRRLGCLKGGSKDVRTHPWFTGLDFKALEAKQHPAPYVPKIKSSTDDSNFDTYTDEGKLNYPQEDFPKEMFAEFAEEWVD